VEGRALQVDKLAALVLHFCGGVVSGEEEVLRVIFVCEGGLTVVPAVFGLVVNVRKSKSVVRALGRNFSAFEVLARIPMSRATIFWYPSGGKD